MATVAVRRVSLLLLIVVLFGAIWLVVHVALRASSVAARGDTAGSRSDR